MPDSGQLTQTAAIPFDADLLDRLMEAAGIDVLLATSKHNVQYLLGGHRSLFFDYMDATGLSRYLPIVIYPKGGRDKAAYIAHRLEKLPDRGVAVLDPASPNRLRHLARCRGEGHRLSAAAPASRPATSASSSPSCRPTPPTCCAGPFPKPASRMRVAPRAAARSQAARRAGAPARSLRGVVDVDDGRDRRARPRRTKRETGCARGENRGLTFEYCLITVGPSFNRAPSARRWGEGDMLSLDSGGNYRGYIGDLCRMAFGRAGAGWKTCSPRSRSIQRAARSRSGRARSAAKSTQPTRRGRSVHAHRLEFLAHGMGLVSHEAPRLSASARSATTHRGDRRGGGWFSRSRRPTAPRSGLLKLEDTVAVTAEGCEGYGEGGRGWNRGGTAT